MDPIPLGIPLSNTNNNSIYAHNDSNHGIGGGNNKRNHDDLFHDDVICFLSEDEAEKEMTSPPTFRRKLENAQQVPSTTSTNANTAIAAQQILSVDSSDGLSSTINHVPLWKSNDLAEIEKNLASPKGSDNFKAKLFARKAHILINREKNKEALDAIAKGLKLNENKVELILYQAWALKNLRQFSESLNAVEEGLKQNKKAGKTRERIAELFMHRGDCLNHLGQYEKTLEAIK